MAQRDAEGVRRREGRVGGESTTLGADGTARDDAKLGEVSFASKPIDSRGQHAPVTRRRQQRPERPGHGKDFWWGCKWLHWWYLLVLDMRQRYFHLFLKQFRDWGSGKISCHVTLVKAGPLRKRKNFSSQAPPARAQFWLPIAGEVMLRLITFK